MAVGHGIVEFPVMAFVFFGLAAILDVGFVRPTLLVTGGLVLVWMGAGMLQLARNPEPVARVPTLSGRSPLWSGVVLSGVNPYFLIWWATVGAGLLLRAADYGTMGLLAFAIAHWLCDLAWLWLMSAAVFGGGRLLGDRFQRIVHMLCGLFLLGAALDFLIDGWHRTVEML